MKKDKIVEARGDNGVLKRIVELFERKRKNWNSIKVRKLLWKEMRVMYPQMSGIKKLNSLHCACILRYVNVVKALVQRGADLAAAAEYYNNFSGKRK